jgi:hypothetical protein
MNLEDKILIAIGPMLGTAYRFVWGKDIDSWAKFGIVLAMGSFAMVILTKVVENNTLSIPVGLSISLILGLGMPNIASTITRIFQGSEDATVNTVTNGISRKIKSIMGDDIKNNTTDEQ